MDKVEYKEKLVKWNDGSQYLGEMELMVHLMDLVGHHRVLDYGCGTGYMAKWLRSRTGAQVYCYDKPEWHLYDYQAYDRHGKWKKRQYTFRFHKIYFMHSLAHLPNPFEILRELGRTFLEPDGEIFVMTPNLPWLELQTNASYVPDPTVNKHLAADELQDLVTRAGFYVKQCGQVGNPTHGYHERLYIHATIS